MWRPRCSGFNRDDLGKHRQAHWFSRFILLWPHKHYNLSSLVGQSNSSLFARRQPTIICASPGSFVTSSPSPTNSAASSPLRRFFRCCSQLGQVTLRRVRRRPLSSHLEGGRRCLSYSRHYLSSFDLEGSSSADSLRSPISFTSVVRC